MQMFRVKFALVFLNSCMETFSIIWLALIYSPERIKQYRTHAGCLYWDEFCTCDIWPRVGFRCSWCGCYKEFESLTVVLSVLILKDKLTTAFCSPWKVMFSLESLSAVGFLFTWLIHLAAVGSCCWEIWEAKEAMLLPQSALVVFGEVFRGVCCSAEEVLSPEGLQDVNSRND